jgi:predicted amidohydrolase
MNLLKKQKMNLTVLQTKITNDFDVNLQNLELLILNCKEQDFILAPELAVNGYSYDNMDLAVTYTQKAIDSFTKLSKNKTIAITLTTKENNKYYNTLHIFHNCKIIHTQSKHKIFVLNDERKYFEPGNIDDIKVIDINGVKVASLICFELRFIELWKQIQGADIILVPAMWGAPRKDNFETLCKALAIANQCFVMASSCANSTYAKGSAIISPFGKVVKDDIKEVVSKSINLKEITEMRNHLDVGIK